jgi:hypothetical protein
MNEFYCYCTRGRTHGSSDHDDLPPLLQHCDVDDLNNQDGSSDDELPPLEQESDDDDDDDARLLLIDDSSSNGDLPQ